MKVTETYKSDSTYLKAQDLPPGAEVKVIVNGAEMVELDNKQKISLSFQGKEKTLVLNVTNAAAISHVYGDDTDGWMGKEIILFSTKVDYAGQMVDAIRVRVVKENPDGSVDDIPGF